MSMLIDENERNTQDFESLKNGLEATLKENGKLKLELEESKKEATLLATRVNEKESSETKQDNHLGVDIEFDSPDAISQTMAYLKGHFVQLRANDKTFLTKAIAKCAAGFEIRLFTQAHLTIKRAVVEVAGEQSRYVRKWHIPKKCLHKISPHKQHELLKQIRLLVVAYDNMNEDAIEKLTTAAEVLANLDVLIEVGQVCLSAERSRRQSAPRPLRPSHYGAHDIPLVIDGSLVPIASSSSSSSSSPSSKFNSHSHRMNNNYLYDSNSASFHHHPPPHNRSSSKHYTDDYIDYGPSSSSSSYSSSSSSTTMRGTSVSPYKQRHSSHRSYASQDSILPSDSSFSSSSSSSSSFAMNNSLHQNPPPSRRPTNSRYFDPSSVKEQQQQQQGLFSHQEDEEKIHEGDIAEEEEGGGGGKEEGNDEDNYNIDDDDDEEEDDEQEEKKEEKVLTKSKPISSSSLRKRSGGRSMSSSSIQSKYDPSHHPSSHRNEIESTASKVQSKLEEMELASLHRKQALRRRNNEKKQPTP
eukprot:CAMPEP_0114339994 /NCGR_PEP_ID=MMETSP0101-20121206/8089_1 /TAXON_ID=38822 ORGANISM="Pteridomonas danica, Strain PT" /NCGR_SAMPLE_ID=MMETSP0101 /ASSEMBLY_ACC=CAM_ASM_000211 /LENGTH=525 /DNA_ID=CAMNT_0001473125 /DNA_START=1671 /DNA_END=3248 /DNA_ORIENTATION=+